MKSVSTLSAAIILSATCCFAKEAPAPRGDEHVESIHLFKLPGAHADVEAAIAQREGVYLAVDIRNEKSESELWLWCIGTDGKMVWETMLPRGKKRNDRGSFIGLLPRSGGGARAVVSYLGNDAFIDVGVDGKIAGNQSTVGAGSEPEMLELPGGDLLFFGGALRGKRNEVQTWIMRCTPGGKPRWLRWFNPGKDDVLHGGTPFLDGSIVFVGQTGELNKFGQGPSKLWLLRIDPEGKKLKEAFIDGAGTFPLGGQKIAAAGEKLLVPYSRSQLPPICQVDVTAPMVFDARIARFDANLKLIADVEAPPTDMPGSTTISSGPPFFTTAGSIDGLTIRCLDAEAKDLWKSTVKVDDGMVQPLFTITEGGNTKIVCDYSWFTEKEVLPAEYVMLVTLKPARAAHGGPLKEKSGAGAEIVIAERRAAFDAANNAVNAAMFKAAEAAAKHNIADPDPEAVGKVAGDNDDPKIAEYLKLKNAYLEALATSKRSGDAFRDVLPTEELKVAVEAGEALMASSFEAMAKLLQSGEITDANLEDRRSVTVTGNNPEIARTYLSLKSKYLAGKGRAADARAALERRKVSTDAPNK